MSVIVGRALPDARDGLKPVHRRVLYAMSELGNDWNKAYKKSARVVGDVIGKYHPHGDTAVYDTIVRMAQPFSLRYLLVDGQGNFGSVDGDNAAAMRYTEVRMTKLAHEILADLHKETVDWVPNYDGTEIIPAVMPTKIPNLLVNGSSGIAVGMATNIPPHNLTEIIDGCLALIENSELSVDELMQYIPGPDFPTAGIINGRAGIVEAYRTGRGRIYMRARVSIEDVDQNSARKQLVVSELPYQLNKARLIEKIAELVKEKKIEGISELRDESDKDGMRIVIELRRGEVPEVVLNNLYAQTQMQNVFGINVVALVDGQPRVLNLKDMLNIFISHRREVVTRRTVFELRKARERGHILEGQAVALSNIDPVIALIKASPSAIEAKAALLATAWESSAEQAQAILDLRLHRLTGLEHEKLLAEYQEILTQIGEYLLILNNSKRLMEVICEELATIKAEFGDVRRSEILDARLDLTLEDLIAEEDRVVTISHTGYAKSQPLTAYQAQKRGGKGKSATGVKEEDYIEHLLVANTHTTLLLFSSKGKVYWLKTYEIPEATRTARGRPLVNLLPLEENEQITTILPVDDYKEGYYVFMATRKGTVKKTPLEQFSRPRSVGLIALGLDEGDQLISAAITNESDEIMLISNQGTLVRTRVTEISSLGRNTQGVTLIRLTKNELLVGLERVRELDDTGDGEDIVLDDHQDQSSLH
ncbi:UNVERIFIED_CONTAM: hypothetical protein GTU68_008987 [Idotea baltica]|nr:hypothetical protein [Idotea baltica]